MDDFWKTVLWQQFGAAIDMLENAMRACPDELWSNTGEKPAWIGKGVVGFWYLVYHTLFWLDFYLSESEQGFVPPAPFTLDELDPAGLLPERPYTKDELQRYLDHGREKCRAVIEALTDEKARAPRRLSSGEVNGAELLLYNMRHVQHHVAQLNLLLRQTVDSAPAWVAKTRS
jgi:DinB superfamily